MAFNIILQKNNSEKNRVNKDIKNIKTISGTLKKETSVVNPTFIVEIPLESVVNCNYVTIPSFNRSYYVTDITSVNSNLVQLACHVDVLQSYKDEIKKNTAIIKKQENEWNLYLNDGSFRTYQNAQVITKQFPDGFNTQQFVLAVAGS